MKNHHITTNKKLQALHGGTVLESCPQEKCAYRHGGCRKCDECGCKSYKIDKNCDRCLNCAREEGILRWVDDNDKNVHLVLTSNNIAVSSDVLDEIRRQISKMEADKEKKKEEKQTEKAEVPYVG